MRFFSRFEFLVIRVNPRNLRWACLSKVGFPIGVLGILFLTSCGGANPIGSPPSSSSPQPTPNPSSTVTTKLSFSAGTQPSATATAGSVLSTTPVVQAQDSSGNPIGLSGLGVTLSLYSDSNCSTSSVPNNPIGGAALVGTAATTDSSGKANFLSLAITQAATSLYLKASATGALSTCSNAVNVSPAAASLLGFSVQPSNTLVSSAISPTIQVSAQDAYGNTAPTFSGSITVAIGSNPSSGTLSGTLTQSAVSGIAAFPSLSINSSGTGYTLTASATGLTGATSSSFDVTGGSPAKLAFIVQPSNATGGSGISPAV